MCGTEGSKFEQYFSFATISSTTKQTKTVTGRTLCPNLNLSFPVELFVLNQNFPFQSNLLFLVKLVVSSRTCRPPIELVISSRTCRPSWTCPYLLNMLYSFELGSIIRVELELRSNLMHKMFPVQSQEFFFSIKHPPLFQLNLDFKHLLASQKKQKDRWNSQITKQKVKPAC